MITIDTWHFKLDTINGVQTLTVYGAQGGGMVAISLASFLNGSYPNVGGEIFRAHREELLDWILKEKL